MSETYQSKRERWQRVQAALPADLRPHISLRNVEAVSALTFQAQTCLLDAIRAGLKGLPRHLGRLLVFAAFLAAGSSRHFPREITLVSGLL
jgi:hypothetical protein